MSSELATGGWIRVISARSTRDAWNGQVGQIVGVSSQPGGLIQVAFGRNLSRFFQDEIESITPPKEN